MPVWIDEWRWEEDDLEELANHGVRRDTVLQVAHERPKFRRNKRAGERRTR